MRKINVFGKVMSFPADASNEEIEIFLNENEHLLNPDYEEPSGFSGLAGSIVRGAKQTGRMAGAAIDTLTGNLRGVENYADEAAAAMQRDTPVEQKTLIRDLSAIDREQGVMGQIGDTLSAAKRNPMGAGQFIVEQAPNTVVSLGAGYAGFKTGAAAGAFVGPMGAAIGGTLGFLSGMFLGNYLLESGGKAIEKAGDEDGFTKQDKDAAIREGAVKAAVITGVDALTFKLGGAITQRLGRSAINSGAKAEAAVLMNAGVDMSSPATINAALKNSPELFKAARIAGEKASLQALSRTRKAGIIGTGLVAETLGEGVGDYAGEYAATGKPDVVDSTMEALSGLTQSAIQAAYNFNKLKAGNDLSARGIHKAVSSVNDHDRNEGINKINAARTVEEAIEAASDVVSKKPTTNDDLLRAADPTLADIERLTGLKPTEAIDQAIAESRQNIASNNAANRREAAIVLPDGTTGISRPDGSQSIILELSANSRHANIENSGNINLSDPSIFKPNNLIGINSFSNTDPVSSKPVPNGSDVKPGLSGDNLSAVPVIPQVDNGVVGDRIRNGFSSSEAESVENFPNQSVADIQFVSNLNRTKSFKEKGFDGLNRDAQGIVMRVMSRAAHDDKILDSVIRLIPVDVVNDLGRVKLTPEMLLHDPSVFFDPGLGGDSNSSVPLNIRAANAVVEAITRVAAKNPSAFVPGYFVPRPVDTNSASSTIDNRHDITPNSDVVTGALDVDASNVPLIIPKNKRQDTSPSRTLKETASWVVKDKSSGEALFETFDKKKVDMLNTDKYEAIPILKHLQSLNKKTKNEPGQPNEQQSKAETDNARSSEEDERVENENIPPISVLKKIYVNIPIVDGNGNEITYKGSQELHPGRTRADIALAEVDDRISLIKQLIGCMNA